jgi:hypothetical protein
VTVNSIKTVCLSHLYSSVASYPNHIFILLVFNVLIYVPGSAVLNWVTYLLTYSMVQSPY